LLQAKFQIVDTLRQPADLGFRHDKTSTAHLRSQKMPQCAQAMANVAVKPILKLNHALRQHLLGLDYDLRRGARRGCTQVRDEVGDREIR
jgi:hypothetical protein